MKKTTTLLLAASLASALALAGCSSSSTTGSGSTSSSGKTIGVVLSNSSNPYFQIMSTNIKAAAEKAGYKVIERDSPDGINNDTFNNAVDSMVTLGVSGLITAPIGASNLQALKRAADKGIPVVELDSAVPGWDGETALIATDNLVAGADSAEILVDGLNAAKKPLNVAIINNTLGYQSVNDRTKGAQAAFAKAGAKVVTIIDGGKSTAESQSNVETALRAHPEIDGILGTVSLYSVGAVQALRTNGLKPTDVLITGVDGTDAEYALIKAGTYLGTAAQQPGDMGTQGVQAIADALAKKTVKKSIAIPPLKVTATNVADVSK